VSSVNAAGGQSNKRLIALVLAVIAVLFIILGVVYLTVAPSSLPGFLGNRSYDHHTKRMIASFVLAVVFLGAAWFTGKGAKSGNASTDSTPVDASASK
jgi:amino acid permease